MPEFFEPASRKIMLLMSSIAVTSGGPGEGLVDFSFTVDGTFCGAGHSELLFATSFVVTDIQLKIKRRRHTIKNIALFEKERLL